MNEKEETIKTVDLSEQALAEEREAHDAKTDRLLIKGVAPHKEKKTASYQVELARVHKELATIKSSKKTPGVAPSLVVELTEREEMDQMPTPQKADSPRKLTG